MVFWGVFGEIIGLIGLMGIWGVFGELVGLIGILGSIWGDSSSYEDLGSFGGACRAN